MEQSQSDIDRAVVYCEQRITARLDGMEKAVEVFHADLTRVPTAVDRSILALRELLEARVSASEASIESINSSLNRRGQDIRDQVIHLQELITAELKQIDIKIDKIDSVSQERFTRIDTQFIERDKRTDQLSLADKTAVAAALQAAKEAVGAQNTSNSIAIAKSESSTVESIRQLQALFSTANEAMNEKINDVRSRLDRGEAGAGVGREKGRDIRDNIAVIISVLAVFAAMGSFIVGYVHH